MENNIDYIELVQKAQVGDKECLNRLIEVFRGRLYTYVYRLVLDHEQTQDIVQEAMLEMFKFLNKLERAERFWPWLRTIATNKIHHRCKQEKHRKTISSGIYQNMRKKGEEALANLVSEELKQIVAATMHELHPRQREVLVLRCYEEMPYSEIAEHMDCSEFASRMLFLRAKKALARKLARRGLGKGSLLMALVVFGKMTATSEAAAANVSVTAATLKVGTAASLAGMATSKTAVVSLAAAGMVAVGSVVIAPSGERIDMGPEKCQAKSTISATYQKMSTGAQECMYFFPKAADASVMMRLIKLDSSGRRSYCQVLQNQHANYYFDKRKNTIYINNYRVWHSDLSVWWLPTDGSRLRDFLAQVEGERHWAKHIQHNADGLLVVVKPSKDEDGNKLRVTHHYNVLGEDYFQYDWQEGAKLIDNRDAMHRRGWTYFTIEGQINGQDVSGTGRIPFVYAASKRYYPWLRLKLQDKEIVDEGNGTLLKGLGRPWMGLHTIDTVRRDAAEQRIWFETRLMEGGAKAEVTLTRDKGKLVYTIDMEADVVEKIAFCNQGKTEAGELRFSYLQDIGNAGAEFTELRVKRYTRSQQTSRGILWLFELMNDE